MEENRIKILRSELGLTMEKFAKPLGVGKTAISKIENGERSLTDQMIRSICREYDVNESWLRTGDGEMRNNKPDSDLKKKIDNVFSSEDENFRRRLLTMLLNIDAEDMKKLEAYANKYLYPRTYTDKSSQEQIIKEKVGNYEAELRAEFASKESQEASPTGSTGTGSHKAI